VTKRGLMLGLLTPVIVALAVLVAVRTGQAVEPGRQRDQTWGAVGDSITSGRGASDPATMSYPAQAGVAGLGLPGQCLVAPACNWRPLVDTFPGELAQLQRTDGVDAVVVEIGINDLGHITDRQFRDAYTRLRTEGASRGVRVVLSTITPYGESNRSSPALEQQRERVNAWIRSQPEYVDYAAALEADHRMRPEYDSGDGLHPGDAGCARMALALRAWISHDAFVGVGDSFLGVSDGT
jgi:lysophospholipase L1-like esterase